MAAFRTGWDEDDLLLLAYATDYEYAAHSQADRGHFNLYAFGRKWAVDSGYGNDAKIEHSATPSEAHNIVLIDGVGQAFDPSMRQSGTFADIVAYRRDADGGHVAIDQKDAYDWNVRYHYQNRTPFNPVNRAKRHIFLVEGGEVPPYVLVYDDIQKDDQPHAYTWQFHTDPGNDVHVGTNGVVLSTLDYSGPVLQANGSGGWSDPVSPGFNIFKEKAGDITFTVDVPEAGDHALWALGRGTPHTWGETEVFVGDHSFGRFKIGQTRDFCWVKFSLNKDRMHRTEWISLKKGENQITLRGVSSGYEAARFVLSSDPDFVPRGLDRQGRNLVKFGTGQITSLTNAVVRHVDAVSDAECGVTMLHPADCAVTVDDYQPTRVPHSLSAYRPTTYFSGKTSATKVSLFAIKPDFSLRYNL